MEKKYENLDDLLNEVITEVHCSQPMLMVFPKEMLMTFFDELYQCNNDFYNAKCMKAPDHETIYNRDGSAISYREIPKNIFNIPLSAESVYVFFKAARNCKTVLSILKTGQFGDLLEEIAKASDKLSISGEDSWRMLLNELVSIAGLFNDVYEFIMFFKGEQEA